MFEIKSDLSEREIEILRLVATGATNKGIAKDLSISVNTVKVHLRNIFNKLEVSSRTEAAMYAVNAGIVPSISDDSEFVDEFEEHVLLDIPTLPKTIDEFIGQPKLLFWVLLSFLLIVIFIIVSVIYYNRQNNNMKNQELTLELSSPGWQNLADIPTPRHSFAAVVHDNFIYLIGGRSGQEVVGINERYDTDTDTWTTAAIKPTHVYEVGAVVIGGEIYLPGGRLRSGEVTNVLEIYNPRSNHWRTGPPMPNALSAYSFVAFEGSLYIFGGWDGERFVDDVYEFDPRSDSWKSKKSMSVPRGYANSVVSREYIYVFGGYDGRKVLDLNEIYQPSIDNGQADPWQSAVPMPEARYGMGATSLADLIYAVGGQGKEGASHGMLQYSPETGQWFTVVGGNTPSWSHLELVSLTTKLYALGGQDNSYSLRDNLVYRVIYTISIPIVPVGPPK
jgi:DNA-binding CsgD family transcriptional regulator